MAVPEGAIVVVVVVGWCNVMIMASVYYHSNAANQESAWDTCKELCKCVLERELCDRAKPQFLLLVSY